jgi:predicted DNA-binding transcriptional regulator AlpA
MTIELKDYVSIQEFARLAGMSHNTLYQYRHHRLYNFPAPALVIGVNKFYKRSDAVAWIKRHRR